MAACLGAASCKGDAAKALDRMIVGKASDGVVDAEDWKALTSMLETDMQAYSAFYEDGAISERELRDYIKEKMENRRPPVEVVFKGIGKGSGMAVNFYLESSGSMPAYDSPRGDGSFKAAVVHMLNSLPGKSAKANMFIVNSTVEKYPEGVERFLKEADIFGAAKGYGDPSYTDFRAIFRSIADKTGAGDISVLVTDMIYSTKEMDGVNPSKIFAEAEGMANTAFKESADVRQTLVVKMDGSYNGPYYPYDSPSSGRRYDGRRPYYIMVIGGNTAMAALASGGDYSAFADFRSLRGYQASHLFATDKPYDPYYSVLLSNPDNMGTFRPVRGQDDRVVELRDAEPDKVAGKLRIAVAVDLGGMLVDKSYSADKANYSVEADVPMSIREIRPINGKDTTPAMKKYLGKATHIIVLETGRVSKPERISVKLLNRLPAWVAKSSTDDDTSFGPGFENTTFGLEHMMRGIQAAYSANGHGENRYFELEIKLDD